MDLALFDFDGTITTKGTYPGFVRFAVRRRRTFAGAVILAPLLVAYRCGLVSDRRIRKAISRVGFWRDDPGRLRAVGERYAADVLPALVRPEALERIAWHKARGDRVVIVSASLDVYLQPWCRTAGVDVVCTELEVQDGRLTGRYVCGDCCGEAKARRVQERYPRSAYGTVYAYGDTDEDREMLEMADRKSFRWKDVSAVPASSSPPGGEPPAVKAP
jgi:phosphatidylglycerophosphatase C